MDFKNKESVKEWSKILKKIYVNNEEDIIMLVEDEIRKVEKENNVKINFLIYNPINDNDINFASKVYLGLSQNIDFYKELFGGYYSKYYKVLIMYMDSSLIRNSNFIFEIFDLLFNDENNRSYYRKCISFIYDHIHITMKRTFDFIIKLSKTGFIYELFEIKGGYILHDVGQEKLLEVIKNSPYILSKNSKKISKETYSKIMDYFKKNINVLLDFKHLGHWYRIYTDFIKNNEEVVEILTNEYTKKLYYKFILDFFKTLKIFDIIEDGEIFLYYLPQKFLYNVKFLLDIKDTCFKYNREDGYFYFGLVLKNIFDDHQLDGIVKKTMYLLIEADNSIFKIIPGIFKNEKFYIYLINMDTKYYLNVPENLKEDEDIIIAVLRKDEKYNLTIPDEYKKDEGFILQIADYNEKILGILNYYNNDMNFFKEAVRKKEKTILYIGNVLGNELLVKDRIKAINFYSEIFTINPKTLEYIPYKIRLDERFFLLSLKRNKEICKYVPDQNAFLLIKAYQNGNLNLYVDQKLFTGDELKEIINLLLNCYKSKRKREEETLMNEELNKISKFKSRYKRLAERMNNMYF